MSELQPEHPQQFQEGEREVFADILRCPITHSTLNWVSDSELVSAEGGRSYHVADGIVRMTLQEDVCEDPTRSVRDFYDAYGWSDGDQGLAGDTKSFVDMRATSYAFTRRCMTRLNKYFSRGGRYLLDAGSGSIPHDALLDYGARFDRRVCVDLSVAGLQAARSKLGDRGVYLQGDITRLPLKSDSMDAITCNHVIYQIPAELQATAFLELWRVLKPGGVGVIVYWWARAPLAEGIERIARRLVRRRDDAASQEQARRPESAPELRHEPQSLSWFQQQNWPFQHQLESFRVVTNTFMRNHVSDDWRGGAFLNALYALQVIAPGFCGRYGVMPVIIIRKGLR